MGQLGVETGILGSEVGDAKRGRYSSPGEDNDVFGLFNKLDSIINRVVLWQLNSLREFTADCQTQKTIVGIVR